MLLEAQSGLPSAKAQSAAKRMRTYRRRRRQGLRCVEVQVGRAELHGLIAKGYLSHDKRNDLRAIALAIGDLMFAIASMALFPSCGEEPFPVTRHAP